MVASSGDKIHELTGISRRRIWYLGRALRCWQCTLRYEGLSAAERAFGRDKKGVVLLLWHNRLFPLLGALQEIDLGGKIIHGLVSASRDGAKLAAFMDAQGIRPVRGSSSRRGATATRELLRVLRGGGMVAITVDGPRGPCYHAHAGAATLLQLTGAQVVFVGAEVENAWRLKSWDRFLIPKPFSRVRLKLRVWHAAGGAGSLRDRPREEVRGELQRELLNLTPDYDLEIPDRVKKECL